MYPLPLVKLLVMLMVGLGLILPGSISDASPSLLQVYAPKIWLEAGEPWARMLAMAEEKLIYIEYGALTDDKYHLLTGDLFRGGWRNISDEFNVTESRLLAELRETLNLPDEAMPYVYPRASADTKLMTAHRGQWQASIYIGRVGNGDTDPDLGLEYMAICTAAGGRKAPDWNRLPPEHFWTPGSRLIGAMVGEFEHVPCEFYRFETTSPVEAVAAHFRRLSPDWIIYSAGVHGAFGFIVSDGMYLEVFREESEQERTAYGVAHWHIKDGER